MTFFENKFRLICKAESDGKKITVTTNPYRILV